jgi:Sulfotransferase domain
MTVLEQWMKDTAVKLNVHRKFLKRMLPIKVHIISHPKSGRTWLRALLGKALCEHFHLDEQWMLQTYKLSLLAGVIPTEFTHDRSEIRVGSNWNELDSDKDFYKKKKVVFIVRDPRDVLVSTYFHATKRIGTLYGVEEDFGSISEFLRNDKYGIRKIMAFYKVWADQQTVPDDFLLLRYEDMHADTEACLRSLLEFIGVRDVPESTIAGAVDYCRFENMKKMERSDKFQTPMLKAANPGDDDSYKVRRGKVGGYRDYLSDEDIEFIEQTILEVEDPFSYSERSQSEKCS